MTRATHRSVVMCVVLALASGLAPASAGRGDGPRDVSRAELRVGGQRQRESSWSTQWFYCEEDGSGTGFAADGFPSPPEKALAVDPGRFRGRIVLDKDEKPSRFRLAARSELDEFGHPSGPSRRVRSRLRPMRRASGDIVGWVIRFRTRIADALYPELFVVWKGDCRDGTGDTSYVFHLEAR